MGDLVSGTFLSQNPACSLAISVSVYFFIRSCTIFSMILLAWYTSATVLWLVHCFVLPFFSIGTKMECVQSSGQFPVSQNATHI